MSAKKCTSPNTSQSPVSESISLLCNLRFSPPFLGEKSPLDFDGDFDLDAPWDGRDHWPIEPRVLRILASDGNIALCGHDSLEALADACASSTSVASRSSCVHLPNTCPSNLKGTQFEEIYNQDGRIGIYNASERRLVIKRYLDKKTRRAWNKTVRYGCRKHLANSRTRVKGRFVKKEVAVKLAAAVEKRQEANALRCNGDLSTQPSHHVEVGGQKVEVCPGTTTSGRRKSARLQQLETSHYENGGYTSDSAVVEGGLCILKARRPRSVSCI